MTRKVGDDVGIEEFELPREYIEARVEAFKRWAKEQYAKAVAEVSGAYYGWLWFFAAARRGDELAAYLTQKATMSRIARLVVAVHKLVADCKAPCPLDEEALRRYATRLGLRSRRREKRPIPQRYAESDYEILRETLPIINELKQKNCGEKCGKSHTPKRRHTH